MSYFETQKAFTKELSPFTDKVVDFSTYKFRCSSIGYLMSDPRSKEDKEAGKLSATSKTYLEELFIEEYFGRKKLLETPAMRKGTLQEQDSIDLLNRVYKSNYQKNEQRFENDYVAGTPDIIGERAIVDIKTNYDIFSFLKAGVTSNYRYQLVCYCWLTGKLEAKLAYCLVNTHDDEIVRQMSYYVDNEETQQQILRNNVYDDIPEQQRIKLYDVDFDLDTEIEKIKVKIKEARIYLNSLLKKYSI